MNVLTNNDGSIDTIKLTIITTTLFSLFVLMGIIILKFYRSFDQRRTKKFHKIWDGIFYEVIMQNFPEIIPRINEKQALFFFRLWCYYQESIRGETKYYLRKLIYKLEAEKIALKWLNHFSNRKKLLAIVVLGHLKEKKAWDQLLEITNQRNSLISLMATRSLLQINDAEALPLLINLIINRSDWNPSLLNDILKKVDPRVLVKTLRLAVKRTYGVRLLNIIPFLNHCPYEKSIIIIREILQKNTDPEIISACIRLLNDSRDLYLVKKFIDHPEWHVRLQVAKALGRIGTNEDLDYLKKYLDDEEWWVRYRAAQSLINFPNVDFNFIKDLLKNLDSFLAKSILNQVMMEEAIKS